MVISLEVMDRELAGALGQDLEKQAEKVLRNQVEASQIALQNQINTGTYNKQLHFCLYFTKFSLNLSILIQFLFLFFLRQTKGDTSGCKS